MARGGKPFRKCYVTNAGWDNSDWTVSNISKRVSANGGIYSHKLMPQTTHLVATQKAWKSQVAVVKEALAFNRENPSDKAIKIVSFDWLEDRWRNNSGSRNDNVYLWEKLEPIKANGSKKSQKSQKTTTDSDDEHKMTHKKPNGKQTKAVEGAKSHAGMMGEVFLESTEKYVDPRARKEIDKKVEHSRRVREEMLAEERKEKEDAAKRVAATYQKGAKKARNDIFSENHHIYTDSTGFKYDVLLTKVDTKHNRNERWALTIYESNAQPHTYAMNAQFARTGTRPHNNVIGAIGCSFRTAFHAFKKEFQDRTRVEWDKRISQFFERAKREKRNRGHGTGSEDGTQRGVPVSENGAVKNATIEEEDFSTAPFQYHPPAYGSRGTLPSEEMEKLGEDVPRADRSEKVDQWMSGGNGAPPVSTNSPPPAENTNDTNGEFHSVVDRMLADMNGKGCNQPPDNQTTGGDEDIDFEGVFDYPFNAGEVYTEDFATDQNDPMQPISFENPYGLPNSFNVGTQEIGETQIAERAHGEISEYLDISNDGDNGLFGDPSKLKMGESILGKRKISPVEDSQERIKKHMPAEIEDSFDGENYVTGSIAGHGEDDGPRLLLEEETTASDDQLMNEMVNMEAIGVE